jgi:peroxiredoxin Q/BCP
MGSSPVERDCRTIPIALRTEAALLREGDPAPDFTLESDSGEEVTLSSLRGRPVVLYFYPKDDTPGCTRQARGIRDAWSEFQRAGAEVFGISADTQASHERFKSKYSLPFTLLADPEHKLGEPYGVAQEGKNSYERSTFVIDADGKVARVMRRVNPDRHADEVLAALAG